MDDTPNWRAFVVVLALAWGWPILILGVLL
jgi:hypothetical protein